MAILKKINAWIVPAERMGEEREMFWGGGSRGLDGDLGWFFQPIPCQATEVLFRVII